MMKRVEISILFLACVCAVVNSAKLPNEDESRVHTHKLSDQDHYVDTDNDNKMEHNPDYDHEAFLGKEEADTFKSLTPEESKERLGKLISKIDKNHDNIVTQHELRNWIRYQHKYYMQKHTDTKWKNVNPNNDEYLTFDELIDNTIGGLETWSDEEKQSKKNDYKVYLKLMERDKKKFKAADLDGDGKLNKNEFSDFLHPEESIHMRDIVINETLEDLDKNGDGVVNVDEFIADIYKVRSSSDSEELIKIEKETFKQYRDKNGDNVLDREEIAAWILPNDYDHTLNEAKHLIHEADDNKDGKLTRKEILDNYSLFVSSRATAYGQAIFEKEDL